MYEILFSLIYNIIIEAFELPVDDFGISQFWVGLLAILDSLFILFAEIFGLGLSMVTVG